MHIQFGLARRLICVLHAFQSILQPLYVTIVAIGGAKTLAAKRLDPALDRAFLPLTF
jgi:hypothetical protein